MFGGTRRFTGGSFSIRSSYDTMRSAGAAARSMLLEAAVKPGKSLSRNCKLN